MKKVLEWIFSHKALTLFISVSAVALGMLAPALIAGSITNMIAVEVMAVSSFVGLLEVGMFGIHENKINRLRKKEVKYANQLQQSEASNTMSKTLTNKNTYKICKKFTKVQLKLAKLQNKSKKALSFSYKPLSFATKNQKKLYNKVAKLEAELNYAEIDDLLKNKQSKKQRNITKKLEKIYEKPTYSMFEENYAPYGYKKKITLPIGKNKPVYDEKYSIRCHRVETAQAFEKLVKDLPFSTKEAGKIMVTFNEDSRIKPIAITIVPEKQLLNKCVNLVFNEVKYLAYDNVTFPIKIEYTNHKGKLKNKIIHDEDQLDQTLKNFKVKQNKNEETNLF